MDGFTGSQDRYSFKILFIAMRKVLQMITNLSVSFSHDGRRLSWVGHDSSIAVADAGLAVSE